MGNSERHNTTRGHFAGWGCGLPTIMIQSLIHKAEYNIDRGGGVVGDEGDSGLGPVVTYEADLVRVERERE